MARITPCALALDNGCGAVGLPGFDSASDPFSPPTVSSIFNAGPMTIASSLPGDCLEKLWDFQTPGLIPGTVSYWSYYTQGCGISSCCPGSQQPYTRPYQWLTTFHSPGVCPKDYKTCVGPANLTPAPGETLAFCCPGEKYSCFNLSTCYSRS
jgi:hypothetical protein